jgi:hypothetical protein
MMTVAAAEAVGALKTDPVANPFEFPEQKPPVSQRSTPPNPPMWTDRQFAEHEREVFGFCSSVLHGAADTCAHRYESGFFDLLQCHPGAFSRSIFRRAGIAK